MSAEPVAPTMLAVADVRYVAELYPRTRTKMIDAVVEQYRDALDELPPIEVARGGILVDGMHRWQAYKREGRTAVPVIDHGNLSDAEIFELACRRNARHGRQLLADEKRDNACDMYRKFGGTTDERYEKIAEILGIKVSVAKKYAADARADEQSRKQAQAWDLWLDCWKQDAIGATVGESQQTISNWLQKQESDSRFCRPPGQTEKEPWGRIQHFDVWNFHTTSDDAGTSSYFGKLPPQVLENVLWLYTAPGQIVVDPFAGGGTTIDVAKRMGRRVWASDLRPSTPTLPIHSHDITGGWPPDAPNKADLIFLDPPYWKQAAGRYSDTPDDLGNQTLEQFMASWNAVLDACVPHLTAGGRLAFIISPSVDGEDVVDHAAEMTFAAWAQGLRTERRIIVTYNTQQATGQQVTWAREHRELLKLYRDLVILQTAR